MDTRQKLRLLCLDGGGIRGLSSLYILQKIMDSANERRQESGQPPIRPYNYFDVICGTSTGGIIAVMLGRLQMDVDECIQQYLFLAKKVFERIHRMPVDARGKIQARCNTAALETCILELLRARGLSENTLLKNDDPYACKVFVTAKKANLDSLVTFTSYRTLRGDRDLYLRTTILQACRATSAAPTYFEPLGILLGNGYKPSFIDGGLGYNNPIEVLEDQVKDCWKIQQISESTELLLSIGTGKPEVHDYSQSVRDLLDKLKNIATDSEAIAERFCKRHWDDMVKRKTYHRFSVVKGLENIELGEVEQQGRIIDITKDYIQQEQVWRSLEECVSRMTQSQRLSKLMLTESSTSQTRSQQPTSSIELRTTFTVARKKLSGSQCNEAIDSFSHIFFQSERELGASDTERIHLLNDITHELREHHKVQQPPNDPSSAFDLYVRQTFSSGEFALAEHYLSTIWDLCLNLVGLKDPTIREHAPSLFALVSTKLFNFGLELLECSQDERSERLFTKARQGFLVLQQNADSQLQQEYGKLIQIIDEAEKKLSQKIQQNRSKKGKERTPRQAQIQGEEEKQHWPNQNSSSRWSKMNPFSKQRR